MWARAWTHARRGTKQGGEAAAAADYYRSTHGMFPVKWTPPEAMETCKFTSATDVREPNQPIPQRGR